MSRSRFKDSNLPHLSAPPAVFAANSFWYARIPPDAPLHESSSYFVTEFLRQKKAYYGNVTINTNSFASPVYIVGPEVKNVEVKQWDCQHKGFLDKPLGEQWHLVPIPA